MTWAAISSTWAAGRLPHRHTRACSVSPSTSSMAKKSWPSVARSPKKNTLATCGWRGPAAAWASRKKRAHPRGARQFVVDHLRRHRAVQRRVGGTVGYAHAAAAEFGEGAVFAPGDLVVGEVCIVRGFALPGSGSGASSLVSPPSRAGSSRQPRQSWPVPLAGETNVAPQARQTVIDGEGSTGSRL